MKLLTLAISAVAFSSVSSPSSAAIYNFGFDGYDSAIASVAGSFTTRDNNPISTITDVSGNITIGDYQYDFLLQQFVFVTYSYETISGLSSDPSQISGMGTLLSLKFIAGSVSYDLELTGPSRFPYPANLSGTLTDSLSRNFVGVGSYELTALSQVPLPASLPMLGGAILLLASGHQLRQWHRAKREVTA